MGQNERRADVIEKVTDIVLEAMDEAHGGPWHKGPSIGGHGHAERIVTMLEAEGVLTPEPEPDVDGGMDAPDGY